MCPRNIWRLGNAIFPCLDLGILGIKSHRNCNGWALTQITWVSASGGDCYDVALIVCEQSLNIESHVLSYLHQLLNFIVRQCCRFSLFEGRNAPILVLFLRCSLDKIDEVCDRVEAMRVVLQGIESLRDIYNCQEPILK